jgi:tetratricopeptide (TPR) repeat protein
MPTRLSFPSSRFIVAGVASVLALAAGLGGAQTTSGPGAEAIESAPADVRTRSLSADLMYRLLVGDIALQRGEAALAARAYYEAARESREPALARRATEVSLAVRQRGLAMDSARLWSELDPTAERPRQVIAVLTSGATGRGADAFGTDAELKAELERVLAQAASSGEGVGDAFLQLNRLLAHEPDKPATLRLILTLAQPYPNVAEAQFAIALAALNTGPADPATSAIAVQAIDRALALKPHWERAVLLKAEVLGRQSPARAAEYLDEFLKLEPDSKPALVALAQVRVEQKRYADARAIFQRLWDADRGNADYQFAVAALAFQMKDWVAAEALFAELKRADYGESGSVDFYLAQIAEETARFDLALQRYRAVSEGERAWPAKLRAAAMLAKLSRVDEARRYLADLPAVTIEQRKDVRQAEAQLLRDAGENAKAYAVLTQALLEHPDDPDLLYDVAMVAEKLDRIDVAEARLQRLIELRPANAQALNALGYTLVDRTPRIADGLVLIERALELSPDDPFILDSMGWAQFRLGKLDDAEKYLRRALDERPDPEIAAHLGEVLWVKGERVRAQEIWQSQLRTAPENPVLLETMRRLTR